MNEANYSIGEISDITGITIKALRHYDAIGLLKPAYINPDSKYRYYSENQIAIITLIKDLKLIGMPLQEIKALIADQDLSRIIQIMKSQRNKLSDQIENLQLILSSLSNKVHIYEELQEQSFEAYSKQRVRIEEVPEQYIAFDRERCLCEPKTFLKKYNELHKKIVKQQLHISGYASAIFYDDYRTFDHNNADIEVFFPVSNIPKNIPFVRKTPSYFCASIFHKGDYATAPDSYKILLEWIQQQNLEITGAATETYLIDLTIKPSFDDFITKLSIPIKITN